MPFDWTTPVGYAIALIGSFTAIYAVLLGVSPILSFFIGSCWLIVTFTKDVTNDLSQFSAAELRKTNQVGLEMRFCNVIRQLSDTKQLSNIAFEIIELNSLDLKPLLIMNAMIATKIIHLRIFV